MPFRSASNVGFTAVGSDSVAVLPAGTDVNDQLNVSALPSTSLDPLPSSSTALPAATVRSGPAFAIGREFVVVSVTVSGALAETPSLTISCTTYVPCRSTTNVGVAVAAPVSVATLPSGSEANDQANVSASPSTSLEAAPFRCTVLPIATD